MYTVHYRYVPLCRWLRVPCLPCVPRPDVCRGSAVLRRPRWSEPACGPSVPPVRVRWLDGWVVHGVGPDWLVRGVSAGDA
jgi:hypothetical protein